jgi:5-methylthioadenosine/S-adenosylhomocysteine deaminase
MEFFYDSLGEISSRLFKEAGWEENIPHPHRMTPVQYLQEIRLLRAKPALIGCLHLGPTDAAILQHSGCLRLFSPKAFHHLQVGEVPWEKIISDGVPWALGTLGKPWGGSGNLWDEMRFILNEAPEEKRAQYAEAILRAATLGGARALGLEARVGSLLPGKEADFIVIPSPQGDGSLEAGIVDQIHGTQILASFIGGEAVLAR